MKLSDSFSVNYTFILNSSLIHNNSPPVYHDMPYEPGYAPSAIASGLTLSIIFSFSLLFNVISIVSIFVAKAFTPINFLIMNLALADITYSLGIPFFVIQMFNYNLPFGLLGCRIFIFTEFSGIIVGIFTIAALSVERFLDVTDSKNRVSNKFKIVCAIIYSFIIWILAICFSMPIINSIQLVKYGDIITCQSTWEDSSLRLYFIAKFLVIFIIPYIVIIFSSVKLLIFLNEWKKKFNRSHSTRLTVLLRIRKNDKKKEVVEIQETDDAININKTADILPNQNLRRANSVFSTVRSYLKNKNSRRDTKRNIGPAHYLSSVRRKASRLVLVIILLFLIQWSPFWIFQIIMLFSSANVKYLQLIYVIVSTLSYSNTVANPALYMLLTYNFKENCRKICSKMSKAFKRK